MSMALIGLAVASRLARDTRAQETVIVAVIVVAAMAGMGKAGRAGAFARLVAWDKRQTSELRRTLTAAERKAAKHIPAI